MLQGVLPEGVSARLADAAVRFEVLAIKVRFALIENGSIPLFLFVTVAMGGWTAWMAARGLARVWRPYWQCLIALLAVAAAVRFIHFALFSGTLLSARFYLVDAVVVAVVGSIGYRSTRTRQMTSQYPWLYERVGPLKWRERPAAPARP